MKKIHMILALDEQNGLGKDGGLAWKIREDMRYFKKITTGKYPHRSLHSSEGTSPLQEEDKVNAVVMGRKTWDSIPEKFRPLPGRVNAILSRSYTPEDDYGNICKYSSFESAIEKLKKREDIEGIFIIGGAQIYKLALESGYLNTLYLTRVKGDFDCDVFLDIDFSQFEEVSIGEGQENKKGVKFRFEIYKRK